MVLLLVEANDEGLVDVEGGDWLISEIDLSEVVWGVEPMREVWRVVSVVQVESFTDAAASKRYSGSKSSGATSLIRWIRLPKSSSFCARKPVGGFLSWAVLVAR